MKVVAVIQARMGSTRLPGKVLMHLGGHPVLEWCARAAKAAPGVDEVWIATTTEPADDEICLAGFGVPIFRGSETDVLSRFAAVAKASEADIILRLTGDCPFLDPQVIGGVVRLMKDSCADYCSNVSPRTYPDGLDVEGFTRGALLLADREATRPIDRDCVTTWIARNRSRCPAEALINPIPDMQDERWVLDTLDDAKFCAEIVYRWPWYRGPPSMLDILNILDHRPDLRQINQHHPMNERYFEALAEEPIHARSYKRSQAQFEKARAVIPLAAQTFSKSHLQYPQPSPLFVSHGQGGIVWDIDGNEYVDLVSALLPNVLGYRDPDVDAAVRQQLGAGISFSLSTELETELAETLCRIIPCAEAVRFGKTGTDVTTAAVRLARAHTGRDRVLVCGGYHGWADWSVAHKRDLGVPDAVISQTGLLPFGELPPAGVSYAAVIVEPESNPDYLRELRDYCTRTGTVLIFDEVITGFRFHLGGAQAWHGVTPDLATFGKAMANGMPLSAVLGRRDIMAKMAPPDNIFYSGTFFGETLSLAAGIATIKKLERDDVIGKLWNVGQGLADRVDTMLANHGLEDAIWLEGAPCFTRVKFRDDDIAALFRKEMIASGTLIVASHNLCAAHGPSEIRRVRKSYDHALGVVSEALRKGDIKERLAGATVAPMVRAQ